MRRHACLGIVLVVGASACGGDSEPAGQGAGITSTVAIGTQLGEDAPFVYEERANKTWEVRAMVVDSPNSGPSICTDSGGTSLPPVCGDVEVANWNWDKVEGEFRDSGSTWGTFHFIGTLDGDVFTVDGFLD